MTSRIRKGTARILLPTDFQRPARRAFNYGLALARMLGLDLEILHVVKVPSDGEAPPPDSRYLNSLRTSALLELGRLARTAREAGVHAEPLMEFGVPEDRIVHRMGQDQVQLLVMGTEGRIGWDRLRLGSTALAVVRRAPCPVLAVHGGLAGDVVRHAARVRFERMLVATDFSRCADEALQAVSVLAKFAGASVLVVHVDPTGDGKPRGRQKLDRVVRTIREQGLEAAGVCRSGEPIDTILEEAGRWQADIVAAGTQGRRGLARVVLGSVAEGIVRRAGCPVLVVKRAAPLLHARRHGARRRSR